MKLITRWYCMGADESIVDGPYKTRGEAVEAMKAEPGYRHWPFWYRCVQHRYGHEQRDYSHESGWMVTSRELKAEWERSCK